MLDRSLVYKRRSNQVFVIWKNTKRWWWFFWCSCWFHRWLRCEQTMVCYLLSETTFVARWPMAVFLEPTITVMLWMLLTNSFYRKRIRRSATYSCYTRILIMYHFMNLSWCLFMNWLAWWLRSLNRIRMVPLLFYPIWRGLLTFFQTKALRLWHGLILNHMFAAFCKLSGQQSFVLKVIFCHRNWGNDCSAFYWIGNKLYCFGWYGIVSGLNPCPSSSFCRSSSSSHIFLLTIDRGSQSLRS